MVSAHTAANGGARKLTAELLPKIEPEGTMRKASAKKAPMQFRQLHRNHLRELLAAAPMLSTVYYWITGLALTTMSARHGLIPMPTYDIEDEYSDEMWAMMIHKANKKVGNEWHHVSFSQASGTSVKYLLWDSGSDEHLCQPSFGGDRRTGECKAELLRISGTSLGKLGKDCWQGRQLPERHHGAQAGKQRCAVLGKDEQEWILRPT